MIQWTRISPPIVACQGIIRRRPDDIIFGRKDLTESDTDCTRGHQLSKIHKYIILRLEFLL